MGEDTTKIEEKLNIEKDILDLKRQYKLVFHQTQEAKSEYNSIVDSIDKNKKVLEDQKTYLAEVLNDISNAKLSWAIEKDAEWQKINTKLSEAENVIKRKKELNEQEQVLRDIEQRTTEKLNEERALALKNEGERTSLIAERRADTERDQEFKAEQEKFIKDKEQFKEGVSSFVKQWLMKL